MMIGTILSSRYELIEKIGEGGMAVVYKAKCHLLNRYVAIKILKDEFTNDEEVVKKFKGEAAAAAGLNGNNIVNIYDVGSENSINYIVMELVEGKTLKEIINENGRLITKDALDIAIQIAQALECAHSKNIIHRDIKPHNILVTKDGIVKVADFGIAKATSSSTITNTSRILGSAHYFSPEQAKGSYVDCRSDIYSLGIVMYEMVTGKVPFDAENVVSVALKHIQEQVIWPKTINKNISSALNQLILKAVEKEPINRYQNANEMLQDIIRVKKDENYNITTNNLSSDFTRVMEPINVEKHIDDNKGKQIQKEDYGKNKENKGSKSNRRNKRNKKTALIVSTSVAILLIIGITAGIFYTKLSSGNTKEKNGDIIVVPNVVGLSLKEAQNDLEELGFEWVVARKVESDKQKDTIIDVMPKAGLKFEKGHEIRLTISLGEEQITVEDFRGYDKITAEGMLLNYGLKIGKVDEDFSEIYQKGQIISQEPAPRSSVKKNTKIDFVVSKGPQILLKEVPHLKDYTIEQARQVLEINGLILGDTTGVLTVEKELDGKILSQDIAGGTSVKEETKINISYYKYDPSEIKQIQVPYFVGLSVEEAYKLAEEKDIKIEVEGKKDDIIASQNIEPEEKIDPTEVIKLNIVDDNSKETNNDEDKDNNEDDDIIIIDEN